MNRLISTRDAEDIQENQVTGCPLTSALGAIGGKWNLIILYWLDLESRRFNELTRLMPDISHKVLTETLRDLEREGLIVRVVHSQMPSHVEYKLTPYGETVRPLIQEMRSWGREHLVRTRKDALNVPPER